MRKATFEAPLLKLVSSHVKSKFEKYEPKVVEDAELVEDSHRTARDVDTLESDVDLPSARLGGWNRVAIRFFRRSAVDPADVVILLVLEIDRLVYRRERPYSMASARATAARGKSYLLPNDQLIDTTPPDKEC